LSGDSLRDYVILFLVVEGAAVKKLAEEVGAAGEMADWLVNDKVRQAIYDDLWRLADGAKFNPLERPKQMKLLPPEEAFSVENNLLTPTFKLKRNEAKIKFAADIE